METVRFEVLMAVLVDESLLGCFTVSFGKKFEGPWCLHLQSQAVQYLTLRMKAVFPSQSR